MPIYYVMRPDGFLCGDTATGIACFAYASSITWAQAQGDPVASALSMIGAEAGMTVHPDAMISQDRRLAELMADPNARVVEEVTGDPTVPDRRGETTLLHAFGKTLAIRRNTSDRDYHAFIVRRRVAGEAAERARFGSKEEIIADAVYFLSTGALPRAATIC